MGCCDQIYVTFLAIFVSGGAFVCGYAIGTTNGIQNFDGFLEYFGLGNSSGNASCTETSDIDDYGKVIVGTTISFLNIGAAIGTLLAAKPVDLIGRKLTLILSAVLMVLGTLLQSSSVQWAVWMFLLGRLVAGIGYGFFYLAGPLYVVEISPKQIRGILTSMIGPTLIVGFIFGHLTNHFLFDKPFGWRVSRLSISLLSVVYLVGLLFLPKTPRWLMLKGREREAEEVLKSKIFKGNRDKIIEEIKETLVAAGNKGFLQELKVLLKWNNLKRLLPCFVLNFFTAACGAVVVNYSATLFCSLGMSPFVVSMISGGTALIGTVLATMFIDKLGRKVLLVGGGLSLSLITTTAGTLVHVCVQSRRGIPPSGQLYSGASGVLVLTNLYWHLEYNSVDCVQ